jgi:hypothetical protein
MPPKFPTSGPRRSKTFAPSGRFRTLRNRDAGIAFRADIRGNWVPTGRIDFATKLESNADPDQPSEFKLLVEEHRIIESVAGNENLEIQWRPATLKEAKFVTTHYHKYLTENSLI